MASRPGRTTNNWKKNYATRLCRCVAVHLYREGIPPVGAGASV